MTTRSSSTLETSSGIVSGKTLSFGDVTPQDICELISIKLFLFFWHNILLRWLTSSSWWGVSEYDGLCGESLSRGDPLFPAGQIRMKTKTIILYFMKVHWQKLTGKNFFRLCINRFICTKVTWSWFYWSRKTRDLWSSILPHSLP